MQAIDQIANRHFNKLTISKAAKVGIKLIGLTAHTVIYENGSWGTETAYTWSVKGRCEVKSYLESLDLLESSLLG